MTKPKFTSEEQASEYFQYCIEDLSIAYYHEIERARLKFRRGLEKLRDAKELALSQLSKT